MNHLKNFDKKHNTAKIKFIAGVDEAGRGPLAGPVVAAAVVFDKKSFNKEINDSKKVSEKKRNELYVWIVNNCISYGISVINHTEIDRINILQASLKAMHNAVAQLNPIPQLVLIDGNKSFITELKTKTVVKGDAKSFSIAAASIIAKVTRDRIMEEAAKEYPEYSWHLNKGYPTRAHREAVKKHGASPLHRMTFLKKILQQEETQKIYFNNSGGFNAGRKQKE
jgi:ribonuclease HII